MPLRFDVPVSNKVDALNCFGDECSQRSLMDLANRLQANLNTTQEIVNVLEEHSYIAPVFNPKNRLNNTWSITSKGVAFRTRSTVPSVKV